MAPGTAGTEKLSTRFRHSVVFCGLIGPGVAGTADSTFTCLDAVVVEEAHVFESVTDNVWGPPDCVHFTCAIEEDEVTVPPADRVHVATSPG